MSEWTDRRPLHSYHSFGLWCLRGCFGKFSLGICLRFVICDGDTLQSLTFVFQQCRRYFGLFDFEYGRSGREYDCNGLFPFKCDGSSISHDGRLHKPIHAQGKTRYEREHTDQKGEQGIVCLWRIKARHVRQRKWHDYSNDGRIVTVGRLCVSATSIRGREGAGGDRGQQKRIRGFFCNTTKPPPQSLRRSTQGVERYVRFRTHSHFRNVSQYETARQFHAISFRKAAGERHKAAGALARSVAGKTSVRSWPPAKRSGRVP
jgi:hypothetical protein